MKKPIPENVETLIGANLKRLRVERGYTQRDLGERLGVVASHPWKPQTVADAEAGRRKFAAGDLFILATALRVPIPVLLQVPEGTTTVQAGKSLVAVPPAIPLDGDSLGYMLDSLRSLLADLQAYVYPSLGKVDEQIRSAIQTVRLMGISSSGDPQWARTAGKWGAFTDKPEEHADGFDYATQLGEAIRDYYARNQETPEEEP